MATQGSFVKDFFSSIKFIYWEQKNFTYYCAYVDDNGAELVKVQIKELFNFFTQNKDDVLLVNLFVGSGNEFVKLMD